MDFITRTGATFNRGKSKQDYQTPPDFIAAVEAKFGKIGIDLAASAENAKAEHYFTEKDDALKQDWFRIGASLLWLNPPFGSIEPWARKCHYEHQCGCREILLLVPAAVGSCWFEQHIHQRATVYFVRPRICFDGKNPYPKDCLLARFEPGVISSRYYTWKWK